MGHFYVDTKVFPPRSYRFTAVYSRDKEYLYVHLDSDFYLGGPQFRSSPGYRGVPWSLQADKLSSFLSDPFQFITQYSPYYLM
jgi:hypothetical protein